MQTDIQRMAVATHALIRTMKIFNHLNQTTTMKRFFKNKTVVKSKNTKKQFGHVFALFTLKTLHIILLIISFLGANVHLFAQPTNCIESLLRIPTTADQELIADSSITTGNGWTHYINCDQKKLLLSVFTNGNDLGDLQENLIVRSGLKSTYNEQAIDLASADYIDNDLWFVANRYWQIENANELPAGASIRIRFYFNDTDVSDVAASMEEYGIVIDEPSDLYLFQLTGNSFPAFATEVRDNGGFFRLLQSGETPSDFDYVLGEQSDFYYGEMEVTTSTISGGLGFLLFLPDEPLFISGSIEYPTMPGVNDVDVKCENGNSDITDTEGDFACIDLVAGEDYIIIPQKNTNIAEHVTVLDVNRMYRHISGEQLTLPYHLIAADVTHNETYELADITEMREAILLKRNLFSNNTSWRFVPLAYQFPDPLMPFIPSFPEEISIDNMIYSFDSQDFRGIKIGDVAQENNYQLEGDSITPPRFELTDAIVGCGESNDINIALQVTDFENLGGFQFTIEWNPSHLTYRGISDFNLPFLTSNNFNLQLVNSGKIVVLWTSYPSQPSGVFAANHTPIFQLQFSPASTQVEQAEVSITGNAAPIQVVRNNLAITQPRFKNSQITFGEQPFTAIPQINDVSCFGGIDGSIQIDIFPPSTEVIFHWNETGTGSSAMDNLAADDYSVTINPASDCPIIFNQLTVTQPDFLQLAIETTPITCMGRTDASATIDIQGGTPPYHYQWDNDLTVPIVENLAPGSYFITTTDANGCQVKRNFTIADPQPLSVATNIINATHVDNNSGRIEITDVFFGQAPFTYKWSTGSTESFIEKLTPGNYELMLMDANECMNFFAFEISLMTDVDDITPLANINIFPNPTTKQSSLQINYPNHWLSTDYQIKLIDITGRIIQQTPLKSTMIMPAISGIYLLMIEGKDEVFQQKIIVQ